MEDLSGSSFVLNSLLSGVIEAVNVSFHSILVLVIADQFNCHHSRKKHVRAREELLNSRMHQANTRLLDIKLCNEVNNLALLQCFPSVVAVISGLLLQLNLEGQVIRKDNVHVAMLFTVFTSMLSRAVQFNECCSFGAPENIFFYTRTKPNYVQSLKLEHVYNLQIPHQSVPFTVLRRKMLRSGS